MPRSVEIVKTDIITVEDTSEDAETGKLMVHTKSGDVIEVNKNHKHLWPVFEKGKAVEVGYGEYKGYQYVHTAVLVGDKLPSAKEPEMLSEHKEVISKAKAQVSPSAEMTKTDWAEKDRKTRKSIERQKSLDCAKDWCIAKVQGGEDINTFNVLAVAKLFESYLDTGIVVTKSKGGEQIGA